ncbi:MAG: peptidyl-prolyl cis-trans isomerase [Puniceicoccales bacterium]|jgi:peptidyl-prolyl cis-trans isomerase D|nr:peptidyl-prolyl cis-trans isomerase [Puniceicoccales bacterium]
MISALQNFLQKHHKWLLGLLLIIIIVAFVFTIGASPGIGRAKVKRTYFYGQDLSNVREISRIAENVTYAHLLENKDIAAARGSLDRLILRRIASIGLADEFEIPNPSAESLRKYMVSIPGFIDENGDFSRDHYASILEIFDRGGGGKERLKQILCENYRIREVEAMLAGSGVAFDGQVADYLARLFTEYDFLVATITGDGIKVDEDIGEVKMENFYKEHAGKYARPQMHSVSMVKFESKKFEGEIGIPTDEDLMAFFHENRASFAKNADFLDEREYVREAYINAKSTLLAYAAAENFVAELYGSDAELNGEKFARTIEKFGLKKEKIAPYSRKELPDVSGVSATYLLAACDLDAGRYYTDPCPAAFGCVVLFLEEKNEARALAFEEAKQLVRDDIVREKKMAAFTERIERLRREVIASSMAGNDIRSIFDGAAVKYESYEGISVSNAEKKSVDQLHKNALMSMGKTDMLRLVALNENEVLMLAITGRKIPTNETISKDDRSAAEAFFKNFHRNFLLDNFFAELIASIAH